jgi:membrane-bound ClpP family serine protease
MELLVYIALAGVALFLVELLLPTGGVLAVIGALGLVAAGVLALTRHDGAADYIGPGLITLGVLSVGAFFVIGRKVLAAHRDEPVRTGFEELVGERGEVRAPLDPSDPVGHVFVEGALWRARLAEGAAPARVGARVVVEAVDGLTLVVRPAEPPPARHGEEGAG